MRKITNFVGRERICLIFTNQLRTRLGVSFGDPYTTSGGKAIAFHSSVRLRLKSIGQIKLKDDSGREEVFGIKTRSQVIKNRMGPPLRSVDYDIYFDSGIDDYGSWLTMLKDFKLVTQAGAWYTYTDTNTGEEIKFQSKDFQSKILDIPGMKDQVYRAICDKYILNYRAGEDFGVDDIVIETEFDGEES
jgi:recombination protein RecA